MKIREFRAEMWLPREPAEVFEFFSEAINLELLTPPWLRFEILTKEKIQMQPGALIDYRIRIHGISIRWQTQITEWEPIQRFVDEQRRGPYRLWRHEHTFISLADGTLCRDLVRYSTWMDFLVHRWWVRPDIERIFEYRRAQLERRFS